MLFLNKQDIINKFVAHKEVVYIKHSINSVNQWKSLYVR